MPKAYYFTMKVSRPTNAFFYNTLTQSYGLGNHFPHDQAIHSGICIKNNETGEVLYTIEGYPNKEKELYLDVNRESTLQKLQNLPMSVPQSDFTIKQESGQWTQVFDITFFHLSDDCDKVRDEANALLEEFNKHEGPIPYLSYINDCQTVTHHLIYRITGKTAPSPHPLSKTIEGMNCTRGWGDGTNPIDIKKQLESRDEIIQRFKEAGKTLRLK